MWMLRLKCRLHGNTFDKNSLWIANISTETHDSCTNSWDVLRPQNTANLLLLTCRRLFQHATHKIRQIALNTHLHNVRWQWQISTIYSIYFATLNLFGEKRIPWNCQILLFNQNFMSVEKFRNLKFNLWKYRTQNVSEFIVRGSDICWTTMETDSTDVRASSRISCLTSPTWNSLVYRTTTLTCIT